MLVIRHRVWFLFLVVLAGFALADEHPPRGDRADLEFDRLGVRPVDLVYSPDGRWLIGGHGGTGVHRGEAPAGEPAARIWDARTGRLLRNTDGGGQTLGLDVSPDGSRFATATASSVRLWSTADCSLVTELRLQAEARDGPIRGLRGEGLGRSIRDFAFAGDVLAAISSHGEIWVWDWRGGEALTAFNVLSVSPQATRGVRVPVMTTLPELGRVVVALNTELEMRDLRTGERIAMLEGAPTTVRVLTTTPDRTVILAGGHDGRVTAWEATTGRLITSFQAASQGEIIFRLAASPDGRLIVWGDARSTRGQVWDMRLQRITQRLGETEGRVYAVAFSPDGRHVLTSGTDFMISRFPLEALPVEPEPPEAINDAMIRRAIADLGAADDPWRAVDATRLLLRAGERILEELDRAVPSPRLDMRRVEQALVELDDPAFEIRDAAYRYLSTLGPAVERHLRQALANSESVEVQASLRDLLESLPSPERQTAEALLARRVEALRQMLQPAAFEVPPGE
ncbi:MAG: hypothetical protein JJU36_08730 [Phycisphaeraceae bacterium]|nr:hypothetical protein [Phycisphaeraceae bacterium]